MKPKTKQLLLLLAITPIFLFSIQVVHETSHWIVGSTPDNDCKMSFNPLTGGQVVCASVPKNLALFFVIGGVTGAIASLAPMVVSRVRRFKPLVICCISVGVCEIIAAGAETFDHANYVNSLLWPIVLNTLFVVIFLSLTLKLFRSVTITASTTTINPPTVIKAANGITDKQDIYTKVDDAKGEISLLEGGHARALSGDD